MNWSEALDFENKLLVLHAAQLGRNFSPVHVHILAHV